MHLQVAYGLKEVQQKGRWVYTGGGYHRPPLRLQVCRREGLPLSAVTAVGGVAPWEVGGPSYAFCTSSSSRRLPGQRLYI